MAISHLILTCCIVSPTLNHKQPSRSDTSVKEILFEYKQLRMTDDVMRSPLSPKRNERHNYEDPENKSEPSTRAKGGTNTDAVGMIGCRNHLDERDRKMRFETILA